MVRLLFGIGSSWRNKSSPFPLLHFGTRTARRETWRFARNRHIHPAESESDEDRCPSRDGRGRSPCRADTAVGGTAHRRRQPRPRRGRGRRGVLHWRRRLPRGRGIGRRGRRSPLPRCGHGPSHWTPFGGGASSAEVRPGADRHVGTALQSHAGASARRARRDGDQHGRHPAHHPRPEHGLALLAEHRSRLQGRGDRRRAPAEVHAPANHRGRDGAPGSIPSVWRRCGGADGDRHRETSWRGRRSHRRAPCRQGAGAVAGWNLPGGRDDR